jgi:Fic family protein
VINRLLDGFEGKLTTSKYAKLAKSSQDTALRDILALVEHGILQRSQEGGRSTSYALREEVRRIAHFS